MKYNQVLRNHPILRLAAVYQHRPLVHHSSVVFSRTDTDALSFQDINGLLCQIVLKHLVGALSHLALPVKMEATPEHVQLRIVEHGRVAVAALDHL